MRILTINKADLGGGAYRAGWSLFQKYSEAGHRSWLMVGKKFSTDDKVFEIPHRQNQFFLKSLILEFSQRVYHWAFPGSRFLQLFLKIMASPMNSFRIMILGHEDFDYPGTHHLCDPLPEDPEIIHCHNLHSEYFDLTYLPKLSHQYPVILSLHDAWLLSGHCAHSMSCNRWESGCGACPDLNLPPRLYRDGSAYNWQRKKGIYSQSRLYVATSCTWLMDKVKRSILQDSIIESRIIPYGLDLKVFRPSDKAVARQKLGIPLGVPVLLFSGNHLKANVWKNFAMLERALVAASDLMKGKKLVFVALGEASILRGIENVEVISVPFKTERTDEEIASYYQACDIYLHAAQADTFPLAILEAQVCGRPVVATAVCGIPEQIVDVRKYPEQGTGFLCEPGNHLEMAKHITTILESPDLLARLSENASTRARAIYDREREARDYLAWYSEILESKSELSKKH